MLTAKQVCVLFIFCFAAYFPYFLIPQMVEFDSYYYLNALSIPESGFFAVKAALFCCLFAASISIACLGEAFSPKNGWKSGFLVLLAPLFLLEFLKFETEAFAYPLLFLSLAFLFRQGKKNKIIALGLVSIATAIWTGSAIYFAALVPYILLLALPLAATAIAFPQQLILQARRLLPSQANESAWLCGGVSFQGGLLLGIYGFFNKKTHKLLPLACFFGGLGVINPKFAIHLSPILAAALVVGLETFPKIKPLAYGLLIGILAFSPIAITQLYTPTQADIAAIKLAVQEAKGEMIYNDWSTGHAIEYYGGVARNKAGGVSYLECQDCVVLSKRTVPCDCINCPAQIKVYRCPPISMGSTSLTKR